MTPGRSQDFLKASAMRSEAPGDDRRDSIEDRLLSPLARGTRRTTGCQPVDLGFVDRSMSTVVRVAFVGSGTIAHEICQTPDFASPREGHGGPGQE
jgi:hypothetical protein